jgi:hypothetical protein
MCFLFQGALRHALTAGCNSSGKNLSKFTLH